MNTEKNDHTDFTATNINKKAPSSPWSLFGRSEPGFGRLRKRALQLLLLLYPYGLPTRLSEKVTSTQILKKCVYFRFFSLKKASSLGRGPSPCQTAWLAL